LNARPCLVDPDGPDAEYVARFRRDLFRAKGGLLVMMLMREGRVADRKAERARVLALIAPSPAGPDGADHGMDLGPAAHARSTSIERVGGTLRGAGQREATPTYARRVDASTLFERMSMAGQLSDRQARAGMVMLRLSRMAGMAGSVTARLPVMPMPGPDDEERDDADPLVPEGWDARTWHRHLLRQLPGHMASMVDRACDWTPERQAGHPGIRFIAVFQLALTRLADLLGLPKE